MSADLQVAGFLTAKGAADYLGVSYRGFDQWVRRHGVKCERYGRKRLFRRSDLDKVVRFMALRRTA